MSPFTSLIVLENDAMYRQYKVDRGRKDHWAKYPAPERLGKGDPDPAIAAGVIPPRRALPPPPPAELVFDDPMAMAGTAFQPEPAPASLMEWNDFPATAINLVDGDAFAWDVAQSGGLIAEIDLGSSEPSFDFAWIERGWDSELSEEPLSGRTENIVAWNQAKGGVESGLRMGVGYSDLGDYDRARMEFHKVLAVDKYNIVARRELENLERRVIGYQRSARDHTRAAMLREVDEMWETYVPEERGGSGNGLVGAGIEPQFGPPRIAFWSDDETSKIMVVGAGIEPQFGPPRIARSAGFPASTLSEFPVDQASNLSLGSGFGGAGASRSLLGRDLGALRIADAPSPDMEPAPVVTTAPSRVTLPPASFGTMSGGKFLTRGMRAGDFAIAGESIDGLLAQPSRPSPATGPAIAFPRPIFRGAPTPVPDLPNLERPGIPRAHIAAPPEARNVALGKPVSSSTDEPILGHLAMATDGEKDGGDGYYVELDPGKQWLQIDLGREFVIYGIALWHYFKSERIYRDVVVQLSDDPDFGSGATTVFNNDHDNSSGMGVGVDPAYIESNFGRIIDVAAVAARYVRLYSKGNEANELNHYIEVEVYAVPGGDAAPRSTMDLGDERQLEEAASRIAAAIAGERAKGSGADEARIAALSGRLSFAEAALVQARIARLADPEPLPPDVFTDLVSLAPGFWLSDADLNPGGEEGSAVPAGARAVGWRKAVIAPGDDAGAEAVAFNGAGEFRAERRTATGMREIIIGNGTTLWHLYPEIGIGSRRPMTPALAAEVGRAFPFVPPPGDHAAAGESIEFSSAGEITFRRWEGGAEARVEPGRLVEVEGGRTRERAIAFQSAEAPRASDLAPDPDLVVLPMPFLGREAALRLAGREEPTFSQDLMGWTEDEALRLIAAELAAKDQRARGSIRDRFLGRNDRRLGFYTLLLSAGLLGDSVMSAELMDPRLAPGGADSPLADFLAAAALRDPAALKSDAEAPAGFVERWAQLWRLVRDLEAADTGDQRPYEAAVAALDAEPNPLLAQLLLRGIAAAVNEPWQFARLADQTAALPEAQQSYSTRYLAIRYAFRAGDWKAAWAQFRDLTVAEAEAGRPAVLGEDFWQAFDAAGRSAERAEALESMARAYVGAGRTPWALDLASYAAAQGGGSLAPDLLRAALGSGDPADLDPGAQIRAADILLKAELPAEALAFAEAAAEKVPSALAFRLAESAARRSSQADKANRYQERALVLEARDPSQVPPYWTDQCRQAMHRLAEAKPDAGADAAEIADRICAVADAWLAVDQSAPSWTPGDLPEAARLAASALAKLGDEDRSWQYDTFGIGAAAGEADRWAALGMRRSQSGDYARADRAFAEACALEPTNADYLLARANTLAADQQGDAARALYQKIAGGDWQPRFRSAVQQAKDRLRQP
ncbi:MAG: hypothetical protein R3F11_03060 [Verrucomicrobiales bacterium]